MSRRSEARCMRFAKAGLLALVVACGVASTSTAGLFSQDEPFEKAQRAAKLSMRKGDYSVGRQHLQRSIALAPDEETRLKLVTSANRLLYDYARKENREGNSDTAFSLIEAAWDGASLKLRRSFGRLRVRVHTDYVNNHTEKAEEAKRALDLALSVQEYTLASLGDNYSARRAAEEASRLSSKRAHMAEQLSEASRLIEAEDWSGAGKIIASVRTQDHSMENESRALATRLRDRHVAADMRDAAKLLTAKNYREAFEKADSALSLSPNRRAVMELRRRVQAAFITQTKAKYADAVKQDDRTALRALAAQYAALDLGDESAQMTTIVKNRGRSDYHLRQSSHWTAQCDYDKAIQCLNSAIGEWPHNKELRRKKEALSLARGLRERETDVFNSRTLGADAAYAFWKKEASSSNSTWRDKEQRRAGEILARRSMQYAERALKEGCAIVAALYVAKATAVCEGDREIRGAAKSLSNKAIESVDMSSLRRNVWTSISLPSGARGEVDEEDIHRAIARAVGVSTPLVRTRKKTGTTNRATKGVTIAVTVHHFSVRTDISQNSKTRQYVSSIANDPNPEYQGLQQKVANARAALSSAQSAYQAARAQHQRANMHAVASFNASDQQKLIALGAQAAAFSKSSAAERAASNAQSHLNSAVRELNNTSPTIQRKIYATHAYTVQNHVRRGSLRAKVVAEGEDGEVLYSRDISKAIEDSDTTHPGFTPAGIRADPLSLEGESSMKRKLKTKLMEDVPAIATKAITLYWSRKFTRANAIQKRWAKWEALLQCHLQVGQRWTESGVTTVLASGIENLPASALRNVTSLLWRQAER